MALDAYLWSTSSYFVLSLANMARRYNMHVYGIFPLNAYIGGGAPPLK